MTKRVHGRSVYTPTALVASVTTVGPQTSPGVQLYFESTITGCAGGGSGTFHLFYATTTTPVRSVEESVVGSDDDYLDGCGVADGDVMYFPTTEKVQGTTVTWTIPLASLRGYVGRGATFVGARVTADQNDPILGYEGTGTVYVTGYDTSIDSASTDNALVLP